MAENAIEIEAIALYPTYGHDDFWLANDVALLRLAREVPETDYSRPICLNSSPPDMYPIESYECRATGYGKARSTSATRAA